MSRAGAHIRSGEVLKDELPDAWEQVYRLRQTGCKVIEKQRLKHAFRVRQLAFSQAVYLDAIKFSLESGVGSRGSSIVLDANGQQVHSMLDSTWKISPEDASFRAKVLETTCLEGGIPQHQWILCRQVPEVDAWFETTWARFRNGEIYS
jgi:hypothetical protein